MGSLSKLFIFNYYFFILAWILKFAIFKVEAPAAFTAIDLWHNPFCINFPPIKTSLELQKCWLKPIYVMNDPSFKPMNPLVPAAGRCAALRNPGRTKNSAASRYFFSLTSSPGLLKDVETCCRIIVSAYFRLYSGLTKEPICLLGPKNGKKNCKEYDIYCSPHLITWLMLSLQSQDNAICCTHRASVQFDCVSSKPTCTDCVWLTGICSVCISPSAKSNVWIRWQLGDAVKDLDCASFLT